MKLDDYKIGRSSFWVHFTCGAVLGGGVGLAAGWDSERLLVRLLIVLGAAIVVGLLSGIFRDPFWECLIELISWW